MSDETHENSHTPIAELSDPTLEVVHLRELSEDMHRMWEAWEEHVRARGELQELFIRPGSAVNGHVTNFRVVAGLKPQ